MTNKYPIYVISKGRADLKAHTSAFLSNDEVEHKIVVEPQEAELYANRFGENRVLILPFSNLGLGGIPARNWVWEHAKSLDFKRHWILDDNISGVCTWKNGKRIRCHSLEAFIKAENFAEQFSNLAICGLNYRFTALGGAKAGKPFFLNCHVYSCLLILNELSFRWRGRYNEDTDLCLQALTQNWCTANLNTYLTNKAATMTCKGGNTDQLYKDNGRLKMARSLELQWKFKYPNLVKTVSKWNRPQHHVNWKMFKTQLKRELSNGQA